MTIIKQRAVTENGHQRNLRAYINDDKKVLLRDSQNMDGCTNIKRWATFMETTRRRFGHDKASRMVRDKKTGELRQSRNTIMYHQILAFLPDECDINGGKLTPEECMAYAKEYAAKFYPNQQVVFALHNEYCKEDKTHRYAVHMVINRSDIQTKKRLNEGRGQKAEEGVTDEASGGNAGASKPETGGNGDNAVNGGNSGSNGGSSNGGGGSKPQHTHNWLPQTTVVHHDAQYKTIHHDAVVECRDICNQCGADITGNVAGHMEQSFLNGGSCVSHSNKYIETSPDQHGMNRFS